MMTFFRWNSGTSRHFELRQKTSAILNQVNNQSEFYAINWRDPTHFDSEDDYRTGRLWKRQSVTVSGVRSNFENMVAAVKTQFPW